MSPISSNLTSVQIGAAKADGDAMSPSRMETVGKEFEGVFLSMMLKEMRNSIEGDGFFAGDSSDSFGGMFDMFIGQHLSESEPLGISNLMLQQYSKNQSGLQSEQSTKGSTSITA